MKPAKKAGIGKRRNFPSTTTEDGSETSCPARRFAVKQLFGFLDPSQIPERNIELLSSSPEYIFLNVPPRFRTFLEQRVNELNS